MKKSIQLALCTAVLTLPMLSATAKTNTQNTDQKPFSVQIEGLENGKFAQSQLLSEPYGFGCSGGNVSPAIRWQNAPVGTKSFVVTIYDQDAPTGIGWTHWVVANIPANINRLPAGITHINDNLPAGALQTRTDFGVAGYAGACPPKDGSHRYEVTVTALKVEKLPHVTAESTPALVGFFTKANALGEAKIVINDQR